MELINVSCKLEGKPHKLNKYCTFQTEQLFEDSFGGETQFKFGGCFNKLNKLNNLQTMSDSTIPQPFLVISSNCI